ncbi:zinc-finger homeodomain protein 7 [Quercus suber]|uniref:Zinc-finger homeodomain protein 7 n=1 Tax=Quercus suber TaxID=58331 RepID=A0AAW0KS67_QUESU
MGGHMVDHMVDGCGEFLVVGEEDTLDTLKYVACNCYRNFHRKKVNDHHHQKFSTTINNNSNIIIIIIIDLHNHHII